MTGKDSRAGPGELERDPSPKDRGQEREELLAYAFRALSGRALTETELRDRLRRRTKDEALAAEVLARVQELGYQSDDLVARAEGNRRGVGGFRVRQTLKRRGVGEELIEETLAARDRDEEQADATAILERRWPSFARKRDPRASAYAFLARRGFPSGAIWAAIREVSAGAVDPGDVPDGDFGDSGEEDGA